MNFNKGDEASFFKILLCDSVDYLPLPFAFADKYLVKANNKEKTFFLKTNSAVKWSVKYVKIEDKYYFIDGWLKFIKDNVIQKGDFLVFWLRSTSPNIMFQVFVFTPSGCLTHPISSSGAGEGTKLDVVKEEEKRDDHESSRNVQNFLQKVLRISYLQRMPLTNEFWNTTGIQGYDSVWLRNDEEKMWKVKVTKAQRQNSPPMLTRGWKDFRKGNKMKLYDICEISHVKDKVLHVRVIKKRKRGINKK